MCRRLHWMAKIRIGVEEIQLVAHICTVCRKGLSLGTDPVLGVKRSAP